MDTPLTEIGTLVVVVLRANHLPNKKNIGKQDPYCVVSFNGQDQRTKAIKKGQHPEWDAELRFKLYEEVKRSTATPPPLPQKDGKPVKKVPTVQGGKIMNIACYAADLRNPDLIGESSVDLTEVLTRGETDEWFTLTHKGKFAGKVYLEMTFWSNAPAPEKKTAKKAPRNNQYAGPGSFTPLAPGEPVSVSNAGGTMSSSTSLPAMDLYAPVYERHNRNPTVDSVTNEFAEFGVSDQARRESYPPQIDSYGSTYNYSQDTGQSYVYSHNVPDPRQAAPTRQTAPYPHRHSMSGPRPSYLDQPLYQASYEQQPPSTIRRPSHRGRYSVPATSSGFAPVQSSASYSSITSESSRFVSQVPVPSVYDHSQYVEAPGLPVPSISPMPIYPSPSPVPVPSTYTSPLSYNPPQPFPQYAPYHPTGPSQSYVPQDPAPQLYNPYDALEGTPPQMNSATPSPGGSRPLPQPIQPPYLIPISGGQAYGSYPPNSQGHIPPNGFSPIPPPPPQSLESYTLLDVPPPPPIPPRSSPEGRRRQSSLPPPPSRSMSSSFQNYQTPPPPPPPPSSEDPLHRHMGLPQPPVQVAQQPQYRTNLPLPPPAQHPQLRVVPDRQHPLPIPPAPLPMPPAPMSVPSVQQQSYDPLGWHGWQPPQHE